ncbi:hypothetical protein [Hymenobacter jejuensis]|uniref:Uncharacterized protein n=1 Tax=Hymenobacter jejuensis TaxID=2502781 RepID=A0A5B7ZZQ0_9BACT|nr:hypothetical protein [Hymenobacter jejuensis]QDA60694.1 hypothetical protein FHG12_11530 [Hymenobacter jejuensis]
MKTPLLPRLMALAIAVTSLSVSSCSTGTSEGSANVERGHDKEFVNNNTQQTRGNDSNTNGKAADTTKVKTGQQVYDQTTERKDRNGDGLAD